MGAASKAALQVYRQVAGEGGKLRGEEPGGWGGHPDSVCAWFQPCVMVTGVERPRLCWFLSREYRERPTEARYFDSQYSE